MRGFRGIAVLCLALVACADKPDLGVASAAAKADLWAGAASVSLLPTVAGSHEYLVPTWRAYQRLFGNDKGLRINPDLVGYTPENPPPAN